jgi:hypothetical protein
MIVTSAVAPPIDIPTIVRGAKLDCRAVLEDEVDEGTELEGIESTGNDPEGNELKGDAEEVLVAFPLSIEPLLTAKCVVY